MTLGKKERMIAVIVVIAGLAAATHFLIFSQKAATYDQTTQEYQAAVQQLNSAEFINDQAAFDEFNNQTQRYSELVTTVVQELNLQKLDLPTSPPLGALDQWASGTIAMLNQLSQQRSQAVKLTFLDQTGWDLSATLPAAGSTGALADRVSALNNIYQRLKYATSPNDQYQQRTVYNTALTQLGISPQQTSYFYMQYPQGPFFFNSETFLTDVLKGSNAMSATQGNLAPYTNPYSLQRFGPAIPALKKIWMYALIRQELANTPDGSRLQPTDIMNFGEALEVGIPLGESPEPLNSINKQLAALLDIIQIAGRTGVQEILSVKFLRPINVPKASLFVPGAVAEATPAPAATPDPYGGMMGGMMDPMMMGMDMGMGMGGLSATPAIPTPVSDAERVGVGAGIELDIRGDNAALTRFYYELSHLTRTYGIDDLYYFTDPQTNTLRTTATIEVITDVNLTGAPAAGGEAPLQ